MGTCAAPKLAIVFFADFDGLIHARVNIIGVP